ncbi:MAG: hypothetical protein J7641_20635 [Cyanobacteria bacterium SID2]|nr:hypothetical protein [Cyanobacteria bacterium SID2]
MANTQGDPIGVRPDTEFSKVEHSADHSTVERSLESETETNLPVREGGEETPNRAPLPLLTRAVLVSKQLFNRLWGWPLFWFVVLVGFSSTAMGALVWLFSMPPAPDCKSVSNLAPDRERLYCAQQAAESGNLNDIETALALVKSWPDDHPLNRQGTKLMGRWSEKLLDMARRELSEGNLDVALGLLERIPLQSPTYPEARATVDRWDRGWERGQQIYDLAREALKAENWAEAEYQTERLSGIGDDYWSKERRNGLVARIAAEKEGRRKLQQARESVLLETAEECETALKLIKTIDANTYARMEAKAEIEQWSRKVVAVAIEQQQAGNFERALTLAETIPSEASIYPQASEVLLLAQSDTIAASEKNLLSPPVSAQILTLLEALAWVENTSADHPLYASAQQQQPTWEAHLEDLYQLQAASAIASIGQPFALELAMSQAEAISSDRPRRVHAQTLLAFWTKEMERILDRPILRRAEQLAALNTITGYRAAIAQVRQIPEERSSWQEAQALIERSQSEIARLEDQPILEEAEKLAEDKKFAEAVELAQQIESDRPLHGEARKAIDRWREEWRLYEDRPILDEAIELAEAGKLTDAIGTAAEIGPDSPIYLEAQGKIGDWLDERDGGSRNTVTTTAPAAPRAATPDTYNAPAYVAPEPAYVAPEPAYVEPEPAYVAPPSEKKITY